VGSNVTLRRWGATMFIGRTGNQYVAGLNALTVAACCASTCALPRTHFESWLPPPTRVQFDFTHLTPERSSLCALLPMHRAAQGFWPLSESQTYRSCRARNRIAGRAAMRAYAVLDRSLCPRAVEAGASVVPLREALVMQIRSADIFHRTLGAALYQQPPLEFYLDAWHRSAQPWALVVAEDDSNPVVRTLAKLQARTPRLVVLLGRSWREDLKLLLCAPQIALAHSTLRYWLEDQPREAVFSHAFAATHGVYRRPEHIRNWSLWEDPGKRERWRAEPAQLLRLLHMTGKGRWRAVPPPAVSALTGSVAAGVVDNPFGMAYIRRQ